MTPSFSNRELLLFEIFERTARLLSHIERSCRLAHMPVGRTTAQLEAAQHLTTSLKLSIKNSLEIFAAGTSVEEEYLTHKLLSEKLNELLALHNVGLLFVPRPYEPIELLSFLRQTRDLANPDEAYQPAELVFASEHVGDQGLFPSLPSLLDANFADRKAAKIAATSNDSILKFARDTRTSAKSHDAQPASTKFARSIVSLPRIDMGNPCRWPLLLHERAHQELRKGNEDLAKKLDAYLDNADSYTLLVEAAGILCGNVDRQRSEELLRSWITECWCDAYAVKYAGPAVWFAQLHAFFFTTPCYLSETFNLGSKYPPAPFRLRLTKRLACAKYESVGSDLFVQISERIEEEEKLLFGLFDIPQAKPEHEAAMMAIFGVFSSFLRVELHRDSNNDWDISVADWQTLQDEISEGLPIPSVSSGQQHEERASKISEILFAGWVNRNTNLRQSILDLTNQHVSSRLPHDEFPIDKLQWEIDRADESLKRSIQIAEWFRIFRSAAKEQTPPKAVQDITLPTKKNDLPGLLSDSDLQFLLGCKKLRVIPLIDIAEQLKGSTIDLRLGHNFEIFFSNDRGSIDALGDGQSSRVDSMDVDVDILNGISISPGQFILGHTLEYTKLPLDVAAQIEGRSSFARLGLQVHMTANLVEAGFEGCLTLEISNNGNSAVMLYPGMRIAQLRFFRLANAPENSYKKSVPKYSGLLSHNKTKQFSDNEVKIMKEEIKKRKPRKG